MFGNGRAVQLSEAATASLCLPWGGGILSQSAPLTERNPAGWWASRTPPCLDAGFPARRKGEDVNQFVIVWVIFG